MQIHYKQNGTNINKRKVLVLFPKRSDPIFISINRPKEQTCRAYKVVREIFCCVNRPATVENPMSEYPHKNSLTDLSWNKPIFWFLSIEATVAAWNPT